MNTRETIGIIFVLAFTIIIAVLTSKAVKSNEKQVNKVWMDELANRGLIIKNSSGSFRWVSDAKR